MVIVASVSGLRGNKRRAVWAAKRRVPQRMMGVTTSTTIVSASPGFWRVQARMRLPTSHSMPLEKRMAIERMRTKVSQRQSSICKIGKCSGSVIKEPCYRQAPVGTSRKRISAADDFADALAVFLERLDIPQDE